MSGKVFFEGEAIPCQPDKTLLQNLLDHGVALPFGCCQGRCGACKLQAKGSAAIPLQSALFPSERGNALLVCDALPPESGELYLSQPIVSTRYRGTITAKERVASHILRLGVEGPGRWEPGQFVHLYNDSGANRCYSFANSPDSSLPSGASEKVFHIRLRDDGALSRWLDDACQVGDELEYGLAQGESCLPEPNAPLLLIGTGTGIAPLLAIAEAQLHAFPETPILCFWAMPHPEDFYCWGEWVTLMRHYSNVVCVPVLRRATDKSFTEVDLREELTALKHVLLNPSDLDDEKDKSRTMRPSCFHLGELDLALKKVSNGFPLAQSRVALAGSPKMVADLSRWLFLKGVAKSRMHFDTFEPTGA